MAHPITEASPSTRQPPTDLVEWDLDVTFVESGSTVDKLIYMTNDGCGTTCQSACSTTCP